MAAGMLFALVLVIFVRSSEAGTSCGCGRQPAGKEIVLGGQRIIGGQWAEPYSWPWLVSQNWGGPNGHFCGGAILRVRDTVEASDIVLTAGHCLVIPEGGTWLVNAGQHWQSYTYDVQQRKVVKYKRHASYTTFTQNDIMLLKLDKPINFTDTIRPICLPSLREALPTKLKCAVAGWGRTDKNDETQMADIMQQLEMPVYDETQCSNIWGSVFNSSVAMCAGPLNGVSSTCTADSGGILACRRADGTWAQYGIVSFGVSGVCVQAGYPPVFTRLANYIDWVQAGIKELTSL